MAFPVLIAIFTTYGGMDNLSENFYPIICNPAAGAGKSRKKWEKFSARLSDNSVFYKVYFTERPHHATEIAREIVGNGAKRIGIFGGDGTLNEAIQGIVDASGTIPPDIRLTFFPGGSSCDFERHLTSRRDLIKRILQPEEMIFDLGRVECADTDGNLIKRYFINNSSIGIISESIRRFNEPHRTVNFLKNFSIDLAAISAGLSAIASWESLSCHIAIDDRELPVRSLSNLTIFKNPYFGGGMHYKAESRFDDGLLHVFIVDGRSRLKLASTIPSLYTGNTLKKNGTGLYQCKELEFITDSKAPVETDGELVGFPPARYSIIPKALKFYI